jgi:acetylornithine deacetylase
MINVKEIIKSLIAIESISGKEGAIAEVVSRYLRKVGLSPKRIKNNVYAEIGTQGPTLLLNAHMDTVPPSTAWKNNPYDAEEHNGNLYGLGACDDKGALACLIAVMQKLSETTLQGRVIFLASAQEEVSGRDGIRAFLKAYNDIDAAIIAEPTGNTPCASMKGLGYVDIRVTGKAAHASIPDSGKNAIAKAAKVVEAIIAQQWPPEATVVPTTIKGGRKNNVIPDICIIQCDMRFTSSQALIEIEKTLKGIVGKDGEIHMSESHQEKKTAMTERIVTLAEETTGKKAEVFPAFCDAAFLACPFVICGPGEFSQAHAPNEHVAIAELDQAVDIYYKVAQRFLQDSKHIE